MTQLYGYYYPFFCLHAVPGDTVPLRSEVDVRSFAMKSPFLGGLTLKKDYYLCPMQSILPNTWELIYKNPSQGDDVPDDANCLIPKDTFNKILSSLDSLLSSAPDFTSVSSSVDDRIRMLFIAEAFFSSGSLFFNLGYKCSPIFGTDSGEIYSFDTIFDSFIKYLVGVGTSFSIRLSNGDTQVFSVSDGDKYIAPNLPINVSVSTAISIMRENPNFDILASKSGPTDSIVTAYLEGQFSIRTPLLPEKDINISSILAYQLIWSQYFVNPQVDYIYNCEIYRETFRSNFINKFGSESWYTVPWQLL